jgi:phage tail-like protein
MAGTRTFAAGTFALNLDGVTCGFVKSAEGGDAYADVVEITDGASLVTQKHIGGVKYDDIDLSIGFGLAQDVYDWIAATWKRDYSRKDGSVVAADMNGNAKTERQFFKALVSEVTIPALDASAKTAGFLGLKISPEYTRDQKAGGKVAVTKAVAQKQFLAQNFRFELGTLPCDKVTKIESFTVTQEIAVDNVGHGRDFVNEPGKIDFPNLVVTLAAAGADAWVTWFQDFVINGKNTTDQELTGAIVFLSQDRKTELGRVNLVNVGIFRLRDVNPAAQQVARLEAHLYCDRMELQIGKPKPAPVVEPKPLPVGIVKPVLPRPIAPRVNG